MSKKGKEKPAYRKIRRTWERHPGMVVHKHKKDYSRHNKHRAKFEEEIDEILEELDNKRLDNWIKGSENESS